MAWLRRDVKVEVTWADAKLAQDEQTAGLFNGLAVALAMAVLARRTPRVSDAPPVRRWTEAYAVGFVLLVVTYLNLRKNPGTWIKDNGMARVMYGLPLPTWFDLGYAALAVAVLVPLIRHLRRPIPVVPTSWVGKGQLLYVVFLWWIVVGNLDRALARLAGRRLVTEGVIHLNACLGTLFVLLGAGARREDVATYPVELASRRAIRRAILLEEASNRRDRARLGNRPRDLRRPIRRTREPSHPVRAEVDRHDRPALRRLRSGKRKEANLNASPTDRDRTWTRRGHPMADAQGRGDDGGEPGRAGRPSLPAMARSTRPSTRGSRPSR